MRIMCNNNLRDGNPAAKGGSLGPERKGIRYKDGTYAEPGICGSGIGGNYAGKVYG